MFLFFYFNELKYRVLYSIFFFILILLVSLNFGKVLIKVLAIPLLKMNYQNLNFTYFIFTDMSELFFLYLELSVIISLLLLIPFLFLHLWLFLIPGLYNYEKSFLFFIFIGILSFSFIIIFSLYFFLIPFVWSFFLSFEIKEEGGFGVFYEAHIKDYIFFLINILFLFLLGMLIPVIFIIFIYFKIIQVNILVNYRKYFIILIFLISAFITPPDVISQVAVSLPILLFYEFIIFYELLNKSYYKLLDNN